MSFDSLPVLIVTAKTKIAAADIISEIIDNDATSDVRPDEHESSDRVWRLVNKYYSALVRLHARAESDAPRAHAGRVEAHVVHLAPDELEVGAAERRLQAAAWRGGGAADVNVLACDAAGASDALLALCARRRLEPVALREPPAAGDGPCGVAALRAALHAHAWSGLRRAPASAQGEAADEESVEAAEQFARALGALGAGAQHAAALAGAERRALAEQLVAAFAAAMGHPLSDLDL